MARGLSDEPVVDKMVGRSMLTRIPSVDDFWELAVTWGASTLCDELVLDEMAGGCTLT